MITRVLNKIQGWCIEQKAKLAKKQLTREMAFSLSVDHAGTPQEAIEGFVKEVLEEIRMTAKTGRFVCLIDFKWWMNQEHKSTVIDTLIVNLGFSVDWYNNDAFIVTWYDGIDSIQFCPEEQSSK